MSIPRILGACFALAAALAPAPALAGRYESVRILPDGYRKRTGSGFLLKVDDETWLITAYHVVSGANNIVLSFSSTDDSNKYDLEKLATPGFTPDDPLKEKGKLKFCALPDVGLAAVHIPPALAGALRGLDVASLRPGSSTALETGDTVRVLGNPKIKFFGKNERPLNFGANVTINSIGRASEVMTNASGMNDLSLLVLGGGDVKKGYSGGPVIAHTGSQQGRVVGIIVAGNQDWWPDGEEPRSLAVTIEELTIALHARSASCLASIRDQAEWPPDVFSNGYAFDEDEEDVIVDFESIEPSYRPLLADGQFIDVATHGSTEFRVRVSLPGGPNDFKLEVEPSASLYDAEVIDADLLDPERGTIEFVVVLSASEGKRIPLRPFDLDLRLVHHSQESGFALDPVPLRIRVRRSLRFSFAILSGYRMALEDWRPSSQGAVVQPEFAFEIGARGRSAFVLSLAVPIDAGVEQRRVEGTGVEDLPYVAVGGSGLIAKRFRPRKLGYQPGVGFTLAGAHVWRGVGWAFRPSIFAFIALSRDFGARLLVEPRLAGGIELDPVADEIPSPGESNATRIRGFAMLAIGFGLHNARKRHERASGDWVLVDSHK